MKKSRIQNSLLAVFISLFLAQSLASADVSAGEKARDLGGSSDYELDLYDPANDGKIDYDSIELPNEQLDSLENVGSLEVKKMKDLVNAVDMDNAAVTDDITTEQAQSLEADSLRELMQQGQQNRFQAEVQEQASQFRRPNFNARFNSQDN